MKQFFGKISDIMCNILIAILVLTCIALLGSMFIEIVTNEHSFETVSATVTKMKLGAEGKHTYTIYLIGIETEDGYTDMIEIPKKDYAILEVGDTVKIEKETVVSTFLDFPNEYRYHYEGL